MTRRKVQQFVCDRCEKSELVEVEGASPRGWTSVVQIPLGPVDTDGIDRHRELCDGCSHEIARFIEPKNAPDVRLRPPTTAFLVEVEPT
jgi:hypothetical protein